MNEYDEFFISHTWQFGRLWRLVWLLGRHKTHGTRWNSNSTWGTNRSWWTSRRSRGWSCNMSPHDYRTWQHVTWFNAKHKEEILLAWNFFLEVLQIYLTHAVKLWIIFKLKRKNWINNRSCYTIFMLTFKMACLFFKYTNYLRLQLKCANIER
jgi:hypothetical protein